MQRVRKIAGPIIACCAAALIMSSIPGCRREEPKSYKDVKEEAPRSFEIDSAAERGRVTKRRADRAEPSADSRVEKSGEAEEGIRQHEHDQWLRREYELDRPDPEEPAP